jgi:hypothetical protein
VSSLIIHRPPQLKLVKGSGLQRRRKPRAVVRVALHPDEVKAIDVQPVAYLPLPDAAKALPPFQRLSLAQQITLTYQRQQKKSVRVKLAHTDCMVHTENVLNWRVAVWQVGNTRGTVAPRFYFRTECLTLGARGGQKRRGKGDYTTAHDCLTAGRWKAQDRESLWRGRGPYSSPLPEKHHQRRIRRYLPIYTVAPEVIEQVITSPRIPDPALCPVCRKEIRRKRSNLGAHFRRHVREGQLQSAQVEELLSFLVH